MQMKNHELQPIVKGRGAELSRSSEEDSFQNQLQKLEFLCWNTNEWAKWSEKFITEAYVENNLSTETGSKLILGEKCLGNS